MPWVLREARDVPGMGDKAISLIDEAGERRVRVANLAFVGSHSVTGVAALHTDLMKQTVFADLHRLYPQRINNKINGVAPRRWLLGCNPGRATLNADAIGPGSNEDAAKLKAPKTFANDASFRERFATVRRCNKVGLSNDLRESMGIALDPDALFDVQVKGIHEYKRQLLNIIETVALYDRIRSDPEGQWVPRVKLFAGKTASSYHNAKLIIKLANDVAKRVNGDPVVGDLLKIVVVSNYDVSLIERIIPASDLSEQTFIAGTEVSGTGNMKFARNGALTIGTRNGTKIQIKDRVGDENIFIFGMSAAEVAERRAECYDPGAVIEGSGELSQAITAIASGVFSPDDPDRYKGLVAGLYDRDWFMVPADFEANAAAQRSVDARWNDADGWRASAIRNVANVGWFSSDRTIGEYARDIWGVM